MKAPGVFRCLVLLAFCDLSLRLAGYARTLRLGRHMMPFSGEAVEPAVVNEAIQNIIRAVAFYPGRAKCLEQALAGYFVLRRSGVKADLRIGVQPYPFTAHAWLEIDGRPLTESPEYVRHFALFPDIA